ncbi:MAG: M23 family metallopeptidase [Pyrinomonadaceae bacterium]
MKNNSSYNLLLSILSKIKIKNNFSKISKKYLYVGIVSLILIFSLITLASVSLVENDSAESETNFPSEAVLTAQNIQVIPNSAKAGYKAFNYSRPEASEDLALSRGGPEDLIHLSEDEKKSVETEMEKHLRLIVKTSNPGALPTVWAHLGKINNEFGYRSNPFGGGATEFHSGMDIGGDTGDLVAAPAGGVIIEAGWQGGYGNMVEINHGNGLSTRYGHLSRVGVQPGNKVQRGQPIGLVGSTGRSTGPHLHYELRLNDRPINPRRFLPPGPAEIRTLSPR